MKSSTGKIGIDIDEVIAKFMENYLSFHNTKHSTKFKLKNITNYHLWECGIHNSKEESTREVSEFQNSPYFDKIGLIPGAKSAIERLSKQHNLYFITARPKELKQKTTDFFYSHFPKDGFEFIFSGDIYGGEKKSEICKNLGINLMIEDNPHYALDCANEGIRSLLLKKPWNEKYTHHKNITFVKNWKEIMEILI